MAENDINIHPGMKVFGADGNRIGTVADVYANVGDDPTEADRQVTQVEVSDDAEHYGPSSPQGYRAAGPASEELTGDASSIEMPHYYDIQPGSISPRTVADVMYMRIDHGGILGLHATEHLYVPYTAVAGVVPGERVNLDRSQEECRDRYAQKPEFLNRPAEGS